MLLLMKIKEGYAVPRCLDYFRLIILLVTRHFTLHRLIFVSLFVCFFFSVFLYSCTPLFFSIFNLFFLALFLSSFLYSFFPTVVPFFPLYFLFFPSNNSRYLSVCLSFSLSIRPSSRGSFCLSVSLSLSFSLSLFK